jgi:hypothetical protein
VCREQQPVSGHGDALDGHLALGFGPAFVRVGIHPFHCQTGDDHDRRTCDTRIGSHGVGFDIRGIVPVAQTIGSQVFAHRLRQAIFVGRLGKDRKPPWLPVV